MNHAINKCFLVDILSPSLAHYQRVLSITDCSLLCCFDFKIVNGLFPVSMKKFVAFYFVKPHKRQLGMMNQIKSPIKIID